MVVLIYIPTLFKFKVITNENNENELETSYLDTS